MRKLCATAMAFFAFILLAGMVACGVQTAPAGVEAAPVRFTEDDREKIRAYYARFSHPPELVDPDSLAPTLEERLAASAMIPPGTGAMPLPADLLNELSELPPGYERFRLGTEVVLMDVRTRQVLDVVPFVLGTEVEN